MPTQDQSGHTGALSPHPDPKLPVQGGLEEKEQSGLDAPKEMSGSLTRPLAAARAAFIPQGPHSPCAKATLYQRSKPPHSKC